MFSRKLAYTLIADERVLVTAGADMNAFIGVVMDAVALQDIGRRAASDVDTVPNVAGRVPVVMDLVVDEAIVVGALQTDATQKPGHLTVLHSGPGRAPRQVDAKLLGAASQAANGMAPTVQGDIADDVQAVSGARPELGGHPVVRAHLIPTLAGDRATALTGYADGRQTAADKSDREELFAIAWTLPYTALGSSASEACPRFLS